MTRIVVGWGSTCALAAFAACSSAGGGAAQGGPDAAVEAGAYGDAAPDAPVADASDTVQGDARAGDGPGGDPVDAPSGDGAADAGAAGTCPAAQRLCSGICVPDDVLNCGQCGRDCTTLHATSTPACTAGQCAFPSLTCAAGWGHCSSQASDGCETDLTAAAHCGSCSVACASPPLCSTNGGVSACVTASAVAVGYDFTLALLSDGTVDSWGGNAGGYVTVGSGQLGNGTSTMTSKPGRVSNTTTATAIAAGDGHACALLAGGTVECWGDNSEGQLGTDPVATPASLVPVAVAGLTNVVAIDVGTQHSCALISDGTVKCWGTNDYLELGNTTVTASCNGTAQICTPTPTVVSGLTNVTAIAAGSDHTCALISGGTVKCWGYDDQGQLGNGTTAAPYDATPGPVLNISTAIAIAAWDAGGCAVLADHTVRCWGENNRGQLGSGSASSNSATPVTVSGLSNVVSLSVGSTARTVCAVKADHTAMCWGDNKTGELGSGAPTSTDLSETPVQVSGLTTVAQIAAGGNVTCARLTTGNITCWGSNADGNLANASAAADYNALPLPVQW